MASRNWWSCKGCNTAQAWAGRGSTIALRFVLCTLRFSRCALHGALGPTDLLPHRADVHVLPLIADLIEVGKP